MLIQLYTDFNDLEFETISWDANGDSVETAKFKGKWDIDYGIAKIRDNDQITWVISGGYIFEDLDSLDEVIKMMKEIQKGRLQESQDF